MDIFERFSKKSARNARTVKDAKAYLSRRYDLLKLEFVEKSSQLLSIVLSMLIVVVCALAVLLYLSSALISWLTIALNAGWAYTIVCAIFVAIIAFVLHKKDTLFVKPLIRKISTVLYREKQDDAIVTTVEEEVEEEGANPQKGGSDE
jgi:hypothetical protein